MTKSLMTWAFLLSTLFIPTGGANENSGVDLVFADYAKLVETRRHLQQNDPNTRTMVQALIRKADHALTQDLVTVMHKKRVAPSGDKHDYLTLAPYWWPDPQKTDGLPYIRHDGRVNPSARGDNVDYSAKQQFFSTVNTLAMAFFYSGDARYAQKAVAWLDAWLVNPETRMNPNLNYAQGVPGRSDGRCYGIIEWSGIDQLITPIQLLRAGDVFSESSYQAVIAWFEAYLKWLQTSEKGRLESSRLNNHATWYDVQVSGLLLFLGRKAEARDVLEAVKIRRIATQIEPDGRQPQELARTKSLSYSKMNLRAFQKLVSLGKKVGVDLWHYETTDGRSIPKAAEFLAPYISGKRLWEYPQLQ